MDDGTTSSPEETLVEATSDGDGVERFERLTLPHLSDIARFARSLTRDATVADDLVQETYLQALRGWHTFRNGSDARRWLFTICHNAFVRMKRREHWYVATADTDPELDSLATASAHSMAQRSGTLDLLATMDLAPAIERALDALPSSFLAAVTLVDVEGLSYEEAAVILAVPIGTVRSRLFRGRRLLQDALFAFARDAGFRTHGPVAK
jgi:RNA polymerase sigma-70 factor, ECF subfamily